MRTIYQKLTFILLVLGILTLATGCSLFTPPIIESNYLITFESNGGSHVGSIMQKENTPLLPPEDPIKEGYTFDGWYGNESLITKYIFSKMPNSNLTLYARWNPILYAITIYTLETSAPISINPNSFHFYGTNVTIHAGTLTDVQFVHWYNHTDDEIFTLDASLTFMVTKSLTLEAIYSQTNTYELVTTANIEGAELVRSNPGPYYDFTTVTLTANDVSGYTFVHWYNHTDDEIFTLDASYTFTMAKNLALEAIYTQTSTYEIITTANIEGAELVRSNPGPYYDFAPVTLTASDVPGYTFVHWYDADFNIIASRNQQYQFNIILNRHLQAVYLEDTNRGLFLYSNIEHAMIEVSKESPYIYNEEITIVAPSVLNYEFSHWLDFSLDDIVSTNKTYTFTLTDHRYLVAVYQQIGDAKLAYTTGFEDAAKTSYAEAIVTSMERNWTLADTLIGTSTSDLKTGNRSARLRTGHIQTEFAISYLAKIQFYYGTYGSDPNALLQLYISKDQLNWILLDEFSSSQNLEIYSYTITQQIRQEFALLPADELYIRIASQDEYRVNIDEVRLYKEDVLIPPLPQIELVAGEIQFPNNSERVNITFREGFSPYYSYQQDWSQDYCVAMDEYLGELECSIYGEFSTDQLGEYQVVYYVLDVDGNYASVSLTKVVFRDASYMDYEYDDYYDSINGLYGDELLLALRAIIQSNVTMQTYDDARQILADSDVDPNDPTKVLTIYSRNSVERVWDTISWHREHVWPNSRLGVPRVTGSSRNIAADLHNLRAIVPSINSSRSNKFFANETTGNTFYPEEDRGDVARILFYMVTMYPELTLIDDILGSDPTTNYTIDAAFMGVFTLLLDWHFDDTVDNFETHRNNVISSYQNNRNPFIDYPHLVELIWFDHPAIPLP